MRVFAKSVNSDNFGRDGFAHVYSLALHTLQSRADLFIKVWEDWYGSSQKYSGALASLKALRDMLSGVSNRNCGMRYR